MPLDVSWHLTFPLTLSSACHSFPFGLCTQPLSSTFLLPLSCPVRSGARLISSLEICTCFLIYLLVSPTVAPLQLLVGRNRAMPSAQHTTWHAVNSSTNVSITCFSPTLCLQALAHEYTSWFSFLVPFVPFRPTASHLLGWLLNLLIPQ